ncbi:MAG TPA: hypothetical protein DCW46_01190 [Desulfotomaculum sp.]|nr:hypothetical protein [Desulfotomaculum sp.]
MKGDANKLPFKNFTFNCIVSIEVVDYLEPKRFFQECNRVLQKDGFLSFIRQKTAAYKSIG